MRFYLQTKIVSVIIFYSCTQVNSEGEIIKVVEDGTAAGGLQQRLCRPGRTRARATVRKDEGMEEDEEDKDKEEEEQAAPKRPGQPQKLSR